MNLVLGFLALVPLVMAADWHYSGENGPESWGKNYKDCSLPSQSPIDIIKEDTVYNHDIPGFKLSNYDDNAGNFLIMNNGHTIGALVPVNITLTGGGLPDEYHAAQFHFHWGGESDRGSEHIINGKSYDAEFHLVHFHGNHSSLSDAVALHEGLAVLGVLIKIGDHNPAYERFFKHMKDVTHKGDTLEVPSFPLRGFLPADMSEFWRYSGSLTTPPCYESVVWTVFQNPVEVSKEQLETFRALMFTAEGANVTESMHDNYRPIQPLSGRTVINVKTNDTEEEANYIFTGDDDVELEGDDDEDHHEIKWDYKGKYGPEAWGQYFPDCSRDQQSPINIIPEQAIYMEDLEPLQFNGYAETTEDKYLLLNNGHTLGSLLPLTHNVKGGGLPNDYIADQFHFHWGLTDVEGSEHMVDAKRYPLELHIVHHNTKFETISDAIDQKEGLAVLGIFFKIGKFNQAFDNLKKFLRNVTYNSETAQVNSFPLDTLMPKNREAFFRYEGSLTTPPCYESVIWTVFHEPVEISSEQLAVFRELKKNTRSSNDTTPIAPDYRPVQPIGKRKVYTSVPLDLTPSYVPRPTPEPPAACECKENNNNGAATLATSAGLILTALFLTKIYL